ncbi:HNH endonuclease signature motif containing protein [Pseudonocardia sp. McavD-2-B]|uniref:HNH endonuclease signature motif containing protein n=1 Tax=Pseudonocardia sp. McavD-2-B TaxID=2954499 RepID=UPI002096FC43|nr:HNH endonuclease signature motif containing protein [Pseudonocardia sp. McavD-2-B]MCO7194901.1 HNH endonuclease [Pseudonocardia sp. McavD-2-B]
MPTSTPTTTPAGELSLPDLESELLGLAGHIAAAECRFLRLLAEFDDRGGWCGVGVRSCAHWLTWRAGMSLRTATEHLRVAHALTRLPRITEAFAAGRISYSKVRAVTRLVGADDAVLDRMAAAAPPATATEPLRRPGRDPDDDSGGASVDCASRGGPGDTVRGAGDASDTGTDRSAGDVDGPGTGAGSDLSDAGRTERATTSPAGRGDTGARDGTGSRSVAVAAPEPLGDTEPDDPPLAAAGPDAEQVLLDLALGGTASHVETVVRAVRRRCAPPRDVAARRGVSWHHDVDGSLVVRARLTPEDGALLVAAIEAGVATARPAPAGHTAPPGDEDTDDPAAREGRRSGWDGPDPHEQARRTEEQTPGAVVDTLAARRADALLDLVVRGPGAAGAAVVERGAARVTVVVDAGTGTARLAGGPEIAASTAERLACDARARVLLTDRAANRMYLGRSRRLASPAQIAALTADGGGCCRFPGCHHTRHLHAHHVRHWLRGGPTDVDNLVLLCSFHHRLVHDHGYLVLRPPGEDWLFHRPDGTAVEATGRPLDGSAESLVERNTRARLRIDRSTLTPDWYGDRLDPEPILDALLPPGTTAAAA